MAVPRPSLGQPRSHDIQRHSWETAPPSQLGRTSYRKCIGRHQQNLPGEETHLVSAAADPTNHMYSGKPYFFFSAGHTWPIIRSQIMKVGFPTGSHVLPSSSSNGRPSIIASNAAWIFSTSAGGVVGIQRGSRDANVAAISGVIAAIARPRGMSRIRERTYSSCPSNALRLISPRDLEAKSASTMHACWYVCHLHRSR
ncbi:hypothetical protein CALCODRAFT_311212 [Calocera cornea HHB12733]|uniref:Uncharacterized protein n=1 Tax=Calocera cornea HHB12733 TaxID=1353952 RepID=A0A165FFD8_9BASI|nr:hypothetical protein CALCODRAFT_311212 [Calocera cornea HHB12733]